MTEAVVTSQLELLTKRQKRRRELGDLRPFRDVLAELEEWEREDRERRGEDDVVHALGKVRRRLEAALEEAENPQDDLSIEEYAKLKRISVWAAYKRFNRGRIPGARKDESGTIRIPIESAA